MLFSFNLTLRLQQMLNVYIHLFVFFAIGFYFFLLFVKNVSLIMQL